MRRLSGIAIFLFLITLSSSIAQQVSSEIIISGLSKASSFTIANEAFYIVESGTHQVIKTDLNGQVLERYGNRGSGDYQFDKPHSIATSTGLKIYVSDPGNNRIQVFDKRWQYLSSITAETQFRTQRKIEPTYLVVNKLGEVIFYDKRNKYLGKYDEDGAFLDNIPLPEEVKSVNGIQIKDDKIYILDNKSGLIHRLSSNGFYQTFYESTDAGAFYFGAMTIIAKNGKIEIQGNNNALDLISLSEKINSIIEVEESVYTLTDNSLIRFF